MNKYSSLKLFAKDCNRWLAAKLTEEPSTGDWSAWSAGERVVALAATG